jgi:hypothetical protein
MGTADLPRFLVVDVHTDCCTGVFDSSPWVGENWIAGLYLGGSRFLWGRFRQVDKAARTCSFHPDHSADLSTMVTGNSYPFMDGYWGERAELVLDESRIWNRLAFEASDMVVFLAAGGSSMGTRLSAGAPPGGAVVAGGWDHEHCDICQKKIGGGGESIGYFNSPDSWVCEECYNNFVAPRSLAFCS